MREIFNLNNDWYFKRNYENGLELIADLDGFEKVSLPHSNVELPYNYFDEKLYQIVSCYKLPLNISNDYKDKIIYLHFEGVMAYAKVYLNGVLLCEHKGGYTPFDVRIDKDYDFKAKQNLLTVVADASELENIPPFGGQIDYLTYGGIYREVSLGIYDEIFIKNIKIETDGIFNEEKSVKVDVHIENTTSKQADKEINIRINEKNGKEIFNNCFPVTIVSESQSYNIQIQGLRDIKLWDIDNPNLYEISVELKGAVDIANTGKTDRADTFIETFGFRSAEFTANGFLLNGKSIKIKGLNRHQSFPYVGYAMPKRVQEKDAVILKQDLHLNLVRTSHYPQSKHFLNKCDEIGLLVFEEIPGWQHIGNAQWKEVAKENVREMIKRDWNHPSIIIWGVRINESPDDDEFYTDTNKIAKELDKSRQTGGVRCIPNSKLLEDVYTFNDFNHDGVQAPLRNQMEVTGLSENVPYLITEYNGHMYPTKRFDQEERQMEHSLRHLRVQNAAGIDENISGAIGWCAFDYNTHNDFGSGDRICYHGVMDMFRLHKFASYMYKSQVSPQIEAVLEPVTFWARGERSIGGVLPLVIFTNCDYIEFNFGDNPAKRVYPRKEEFNGVDYAPVIIDFSSITLEEVGAWGMKWEDACFKGYYKDAVIVERKMAKDPIPSTLYVAADDNALCAKEKDATRIVVEMLDQYGNLLPFQDEIIKININGPAKLQGPKELVLKGGCIAFWIETLNESGLIDIEVISNSMGSKNISIEVQ